MTCAKKPLVSHIRGMAAARPLSAQAGFTRVSCRGDPKQ